MGTTACRCVNNTFRQDVGAGGALECGDYSPLWGAAGRRGEAQKRRMNAALQGRLRRRFHGDYGVPVGRGRGAGVNNTFRQDVGAGGALECGDYSPLWGAAGR